MNELANFPKGQILSELVFDIYCELLKDEESCNQLIKSPFIAHKDEDFSYDEKDNERIFPQNENDITLLENAENLITPEICPFSISKVIYKRIN